MKRHSGLNPSRMIVLVGTVVIASFLLLALGLLARPAAALPEMPAEPRPAALLAPPTGDPHTVTLTAEPTVQNIGSIVTLTAVVVDDAAVLLETEIITFSTSFDLGDGDFSAFTATTNISGQASTTVSSTLMGSSLFTATASNDISGTVLVTFTAGPLDHFTFAPVSSPQTAGVSFTVVITAEDVDGYQVKNYNGSAVLSDQTETVTPTDISFSQGVWSDYVTVTQATLATDHLAVAGGGAEGLSNSFAVDAGPAAQVDLTITENLLRPNMQATVVATVTDKHDNPVVDGTEVTFDVASALGTLNPLLGPTSNGVVTTTFTAGEQDGSGEIHATVTEEITGSVSVQVARYKIYLPLVLRNYPPPWERGANGTDGQVYHITTCPHDSEVLYAGSAEAVLKSTDGGATWGQTGKFNDYVFATAVLPGPNCQTVFATVWDQGIKKSVDGGINWDSPVGALPSNQLYFVLADPDNPGALYAGTAAHGVYMTEDSGATWSPAGTGLDGETVLYLALDPDNSSRIYASVALKGIYKINMADSAPTWAYASGGISGDKIMLGVSVAPGTGGQTLLAASTDMGVFMTTDGGNLWNRWGATAYNQNVESVLALEFEGRLVFLAGTNGAGVYRSNDQGNSWFSYSTGLTNMRTRTLSSASAYLAAGDYIFLGSGSGAWRRELVD